VEIKITIDGVGVGKDATEDEADAIPSLVGVPVDAVLPVWAIEPKLSKEEKAKLAPAQLALLKAFKWLTAERQKELSEDADSKEAISHQLIQQAVDEQARERGLWSDSARVLDDTTESSLDDTTEPEDTTDSDEPR
jgi:hypothetical protein